MQTVQDDTGRRYLLLKRSDHASLVRDPDSGNECYIQNDRLESVDERPLETAAATVSEPVRTLLTTVHDEATLGLLVELDARGPLSVRRLLDTYDVCESDLHGHLTVLQAAGLLGETEVDGRRGYRTTETCATALETLTTPTPETNSADESPDGDSEASSVDAADDSDGTVSGDSDDTVLNNSPDARADSGDAPDENANGGELESDL